MCSRATVDSKPLVGMELPPPLDLSAPSEHDLFEHTILSPPLPTNGPPRRKLRIAIVSENIMPKVDGVTRCLARLLAHLRQEGHEAVVLGPESGMTHYETHPLVGTAGIPLVLYPGLKLNFLRPKFLRVIHEFKPDVIHIVEPVWLGAQVLLAIRLGWCGEQWRENAPIVASYHTNLPTYASLFGMRWLEPIMWRWISLLHSRCLLTACPSPSSIQMLKPHGVPLSKMRIWPRGVDLELFGPHRRSEARRTSWKVPEMPLVPLTEDSDANRVSKGSRLLDEMAGRGIAPLPTPPASPEMNPVQDSYSVDRIEKRPVILYVGRISYEKNLALLLHAFSTLLRSLPSIVLRPKLVLIGEGPARGELQALCQTLSLKDGDDVIFEGACFGERLAEGYASADIFAFPSFTETFGQVILEALASGLPVVGLDASGTRDLVTPLSTGLLLPLPPPSNFPATPSSPLLSGSQILPPLEWSNVFANRKRPSPMLIEQFADLLRKLVLNPALRASMSRRASEECMDGRSWHDAMDKMVQCYEEGIEISRVMRGTAGLSEPAGDELERRLTQSGIGACILGTCFLGILFCIF